MKQKKLPETAKELVIWGFSCKISGSSQVHIAADWLSVKKAGG